MKAAVIHPIDGSISGMTIDNRERPKPGAGEILVRSMAVGVCGSDLHYYREGHIGDWWVREPHVLGHEFSGIVTEVGPEVAEIAPDDRVAVEPIIPCDHCDACRRGLYNLCSSFTFTGSPHTDGALQEYVVVPARAAHTIPDSMPFHHGALVEPTSIAVHAVRQSGLSAGNSVMVIGAGPIGLLILAVALAYEAGAAYITDVNDVRLEAAATLGATATFNVSETTASEVVARTEQDGVDIVFEAVGSPETLETALEFVKPGGTVVAVGVNAEERIPFNLMLAQAKEATMVPIYLGRNAFPEAIDLLASGRIDGEVLASHRYPLTRAPEAMEKAAGAGGDAIKVIIEPGEAG